MPYVICPGSQSSGRRTMPLQLYYPPRVPTLTPQTAKLFFVEFGCHVTTLEVFTFVTLYKDESNFFKVKGLYMYHKLLTLVFDITVIIINFALTSINQNNDCHFGNTLLFNDCIMSKIIKKNDDTVEYSDFICLILFQLDKKQMLKICHRNMLLYELVDK